MVALPAFKFIFLGIRQLTRPFAKQIVSRATSKRGVTYSLCIGLGRVSLGLSGVITEWSRKEELKRLENKKKAEEAERKKIAETAEQSAKESVKASSDEAKVPVNEETKRIVKEALDCAGGAASAAASTESKKEAPVSSSAAAAAPSSTAAAAHPEKEHVIAFPTIVTPRSRSLLEPIMYGPNPQKEEPYDASVFLDPDKRTPGAVMRIFITHPYQSAWYVFKTAFLAPFPEKRLVDAGADFVIELIAYTVLAMLLFLELRQASRSAAAKEDRVNARLDAIEEKINELVRASSGAARSNVEQLPPVPELRIKGRLDSLNYFAKASFRMAESFIRDPLASFASDGADDEKNAVPSKAGKKPRALSLSAEERAAAAASVPMYDKNSRLPKAPPPDPLAKKSKHDESSVMKTELARTLGTDANATQ